MSDINNYTFTGNLGNDAEVRQAGSHKVVSFNVAISERFKSSDGNWKGVVTWVTCSIWNRERIAEHLKKGSKVTISGTPRSRAYIDKNGEPKATLEVTVDKISFTPIQ